MKLNFNEYFNILNYKYLSYYNEALNLLSNKKIYPRLATFHINYICNYACPDCKFNKINNETNKNITYNNALKIIKNLLKLKVKSIDFSGGGEPLLTPDIDKIFYFLKKKNIGIGIITNAYALNNKLNKSIIDCANYIRVGLDAATSQTYAIMKNTKEKDFNIVIQNIKNLIKLRKKKKTPEITLKFTINDNNVFEIEKMIKLSIKLKVDAIFIKPYENTKSKIKNIKVYRKSLNDLKIKYKNKIVILGGLDITQPKSACWLSPMQTTVDMFGNIYICSYYSERKNEHILGNLFETNIEKIWFSKTHQKKLKNIDINKCKKYSCKLHNPNFILKELLKEKDKLVFI